MESIKIESQLIEDVKTSGETRFAQALEQARSKVAGQVFLVTEGGPDSAAAFVQKSDVDRGLNNIYLDMDWAYSAANDNQQEFSHVLSHELNHLKFGESEVPMPENFNAEHQRVLDNYTGSAINFKTDFLLEALNESATIADVGSRNPNCAYNQAEVPWEEKLEQLCLQFGVDSPLEAYRKPNPIEVGERIALLAYKLMTYEALRQEDSIDKDTKQRIFWSLKMNDHSEILQDVVNKETAQEAVDQIQAKLVKAKLADSCMDVLAA